MFEPLKSSILRGLIASFFSLGFNNRIKETLTTAMDNTLQKHGAKHIYRVPEGLRELCADISREVLRAQPSDIYCFIADYIDALLITRENAKIAVRVVNNILLGSQAIVAILHESGLSLEQIAIAATRIQKAFRSYLDLVDVQRTEINEGKEIEENSHICIRNIIESTGTSWEQAEVAASTIQSAFRNHYKEMLAREARGEVQWQRAVVNTIAILRRAGVSQEEAGKAVTLIQSSYRGYYTRRNVKLKILSGAAEEKRSKNEGVLEPRETIQAVAWMDMMSEDSKHTVERASEAATIIQSAFRGYRTRALHNHASKVESSRSMVVEAILDNLRRRIWSKVKSAEEFPEELGSREEMEETVERIETEYRDRRRKIRISEQFEEDEVYGTEEPLAEGEIEVESEEDGARSSAEDFETGVEIVLKEDKEGEESEPEIEADEREEPEEESVPAQKSGANRESGGPVEHKEHEEKDSADEEET